MPTYFRMVCWAELRKNDQRCPCCRAESHALSALPYPENCWRRTDIPTRKQFAARFASSVSDA